MSGRFDDAEYWRTYAGQLELQVRHMADLAYIAGCRHINAEGHIERARISAEALVEGARKAEKDDE